MGLIGLAWYISGLSALLALMTSAITYAPPGPGPIEKALPTVFGCGSLLSAGVAIGLGRLPPTHPIRQSRSLWVGFVVAAVTVTLMAVLLG
jgi:hypothetical protein